MELTKQQNEIVNYDKLGTLIVKGTAGSGKSLVGLERINYLFKRKKQTLFSNEQNTKILVITFNKVMYAYLKQSFENLKNSSIDINDVKFINIDRIMYEEAEKITNQLNYNILWENDSTLKNIVYKINKRKNQFDDDFILSEFSWIRKNFITKGNEYLEVVRLGRGKKKLNKEDRQYIWSLLKKYRLELKNRNEIDVLDAYRIMLEISDLEEYKNYNHIIVDEAQDLSRIQLEFILKLNQNNLQKIENSLMILYDDSQSIYDDSWLGYGKPFSLLGLDVRGKVKKLETSYRTTRQIHQAANSLLNFYKDKNLDEESKITPIFSGNEEGIKPLLYSFKEESDELKALVKNIKELTQKIYEYKDIMVISFEKKFIRLIYKTLDSEKIPTHIFDGNKVDEECINFNDNSIRILTAHNAKGLENKVVFVLNTKLLSKKNNFDIKNEEELHIRNSKKLYTAMTRAQEILFLSSDDEYISKIDDKYLRKINNFEETDINYILEESLYFNKDLIETNKTPRLKKAIKVYEEEYTKEQKEQEETKKEVENQLKLLKKETSKSSKKSIKNIFFKTLSEEEIIEKEMKEKFKILDKEIIKIIITQELLYKKYVEEKILDSAEVIASMIYKEYAKIIEIMLKDFLKKITSSDNVKTRLEIIFEIVERYKYLKIFCQDMYKLNLRKKRNEETHEISKNDMITDVKNLRKYLILDKRIIEFHNAIEKQISLELNITPDLDRDVLIEEVGENINIKKKNYYTVLLAGDEKAVYKNKLKSGKYKVGGKYINFNGEKIYVIEAYQEIL